jgi:hypothetical protein
VWLATYAEHRPGWEAGLVSDVEGARSSPDDRRRTAAAATAAALADDSLDGVTGDLQRLCRAAVTVLGVRGAAVLVVSGEGVPRVVAAADAWSRGLADASFDTGEGPTIDAHALARPVLASFLLEEGVARWPGYVELVRPSGVRACFALPLHVGAVRLGVLDLYDDRPDQLAADQVSMALTFADLAVERLLETPGDAGPETLDQRLLTALERRSEIHQAQGMVMVDRGVDLATALALMRAHAFSRSVPLLDLAREILDGARLPDDGGP